MLAPAIAAELLASKIGDGLVRLIANAGTNGH
jgi:hypothetical protein